MIPSSNLAPTSKVTVGVTNIATVPKGTNRVLSHKARTEALYSASYLCRKPKNKATQRAKSKVTIALLPKSFSAKLAPHGRATCLTSPSEVNITDKVISKSPKNRSLKARGLQSEQPRVSLVNTLREFLNSKRKLELLILLPLVVNKWDVSWLWSIQSIAD